jgi:WXG100 protein secretion system (Wss), protein YukD
MQASTLLVTVRGPFTTVDLELPGDVPVGELIPLLLEICGSRENNPKNVLHAPASLQVAGMRAPLSLNKTLIDADVCDGALLVLQTNHTPSSVIQAESFVPRQFVPRAVPPGADTGGIGVAWEGLG